jgi:flagellar biosynthesis protein FliQ
MNALWYIKKRSLINRMKKRLRKPLTYVYAIVAAAYVALMVYSLNFTFEMWGMDSPEGFALILSVITLISLPLNFRSYAKHKGLIYSPADIHMVFPSPVHPKALLMYGMIKLLYTSWILVFALTIGGIWWFHLTAAQVILYLFYSVLLDSLFEVSLVVLVYGNDRISEKTLRWVGRAIYGVIGLAVLLGLYLFFAVDSSIGVAELLFSHPLFQCLPVLGWNIAAIRLILLGPDTVNIVCSLLYVATTAVMVAAAVRMPCRGEYYEDAMTFSEEYQAALNKAKQGRMAVVGKKEKFRSASVSYQGTGAKAIYYRQLLEYKKKRFFIFGGNSLLCLGIGIGLAVLGAIEEINVQTRPFVLPVVCAYIILIFSGYATKWEQELKNAYTFLIPDRPFRKMWYATLIEHIRNLVDGCLIVLPCCLFLKLSLVEILGGIVVYVCFKAANLYARMVCRGILGKLFGQFGMSVVQMMLFFLIVGIGAFFGVMAGMAGGVMAGYLVLIFYCVLLTFGLSAASSAMFARMEMLED